MHGATADLPYPYLGKYAKSWVVAIGEDFLDDSIGLFDPLGDWDLEILIINGVVMTRECVSKDITQIAKRIAARCGKELNLIDILSTK